MRGRRLHEDGRTCIAVRLSVAQRGGRCGGGGRRAVLVVAHLAQLIVHVVIGVTILVPREVLVVLKVVLVVVELVVVVVVVECQVWV